MARTIEKPIAVMQDDDKKDENGERWKKGERKNNNIKQ